MKRPAKQITKREIAAIHAFNARAFGKQAPEVPKARAPSRDLEHKEQCAVIDYWRSAHKTFGLPEFALFAIPNGGHRHMLTAVRLKAEGVRKGIPDLMLATARGNWHGMYIEMKSVDGDVGPEQTEVLTYLYLEKYNARVAWGAQEAIQFIQDYLRGE